MNVPLIPVRMEEDVHKVSISTSATAYQASMEIRAKTVRLSILYSGRRTSRESVHNLTE